MATTKKKRTLLNVIMVVLAVVVVVAGVAFVLSVRGGSGQSSSFNVSSKIGYANIERAGISYALEPGTALQEGDVVETLNGSELSVQVADGPLVCLADASKMRVSANGNAQSGLGLELVSGCVFTDASESGNPVAFESSGNTWTVGDSVVVSDARSGTLTVQVLSGEVELSNGVAVKKGESCTVFTDQAKDGQPSESSEEGSSSYGKASAASSGEAVKLSISALDSFALEHAIDAAKSGHELVFTESQLTDELQRREDERLQQARQASEEGARSAESSNAGETAAGTASSETGRPAEAGAPGSNEAGGENAGVTEGDGQVEESGQTVDNVPATEPEAGEPSEPEQEATYTCTIQIRCDSILDNMDNLADGKSKYVPKSGVLLRSTTMSFEEGESAFDVLNRACKENGIALEYSYVPIYGSYYVEGIGNLYEFDCGDESGWMFKVNGWFPNYGSSQYELSDGDAVTFCYTCKGLGEDVGA